MTSGKDLKKIKFPIKILIAIIFSLSFIISVYASDTLIPIGKTAGIKLLSDGAIVVDISESLPENPAKSAGIKKGDIIKKADNKQILCNYDLKEIITKSNGKEIKIEILRDGKAMTVNAKPVKSKNGECALGIMIRDSIAGIGTITYYNPENNTYGALGHAISDSDTGLIIPVNFGELMRSGISGVKKGKSGNPGELIGEYDIKTEIADIKINCESGIFGTMKNADSFKGLKEYPVAKKEEIKRGKASILTNVSGEEVCEYEVEITTIYHDGEKTKNMVIKVTDPKLLEKTGGIVQGMSGSPIVQNGKLVGAVTHVFVNDPTRGYGIFIENMLAEAE